MGLSGTHQLRDDGGIMRLALGLEYAGENFHGWQTQHTQPSVRTVQRYVEMALSTVANHPVIVICAGRTDRGVHALTQVIHADVQVERPVHAWVLGTNANLPNDISILWAQPVPDDFHARFSAMARHYRYVILNRRARPALLLNKVAWEHQPLVTESMHAAAAYLIGTHDFTSYRAVACQAKTPIRTVTQLTVTRINDKVIIDISANAFLYHMVRNITGVLLAIGRGEQLPEWAHQVLMARDRTVAAVTAPASGLYLCQVDYPQRYGLPTV